MRKLLQETKMVVVGVIAAFGIAGAIVQPVAAQCSGGEQRVSIGFSGATQRGVDAQGNAVYCVPINQGGGIANNPIMIYLKGFLQFLTAGVGIAVVGGLVYGGIVFMTARANAGQTQKAIEIIRTSIIALLLYIFAFALLNWVVPGGVLT